MTQKPKFGPRSILNSKKRSSIQPKTTEAIFDTGATGTIITLRSIVHYDSRAGLSIVSASDCHAQGHQWEFRQGNKIEQDALLLHTQKHTYKFQHSDGLC